jgi:hypothetical protein
MVRDKTTVRDQRRVRARKTARTEGRMQGRGRVRKGKLAHAGVARRRQNNVDARRA